MKSILAWEDGFNRNFILSELNECRSVANGVCSFKAAEYAFWLPVLKSAIRSPKSARHLKGRCIKEALNDPSLALNNPASFIERCNKAYNRILAGNRRRFIMVCSVTYSGPALIKELTDRNTEIRWQPAAKSNFYRRALRSRETLSDVFASHKIPKAPPGLTDILVYVDAFDAWDALELATNSLDRFRGLLNLIVNSRRGINPFFRTTIPHAVNRFRLGPYRTMHLPNGDLASEQFWYEPRWSHDQASAKFTGDADQTAKKIKEWWMETIKNPLKERISDGLLRYCRALDQHDSDASLLGLWGALESLTGTQKEKYEITVSRAVCLFKDHEPMRQVARHIMLRRNATVHAAVSAEDDEVDAVILLAERLVGRALFFCMQKGKLFENADEFSKFLDFPLELKTLHRQQRLISAFIKFQQR